MERGYPVDAAATQEGAHSPTSVVRHPVTVARHRRPMPGRSRLQRGIPHGELAQTSV